MRLDKTAIIVILTGLALTVPAVASGQGFKVVVNAHPAICDMFQREEKRALQRASARYARQIVLQARRDYHLEQFDLSGQ